jgi:ribonuclease VapC
LTLFVDASALVSIIAGEEDDESLALRVITDSDPIWSALSCWETISGLSRSRRYDLPLARIEVEQFARSRPFRMVPIDEKERQLAIDAFLHFGKGRHRANLNFGDCFAYACAKANDAELLYKGGDFIHTDLA